MTANVVMILLRGCVKIVSHKFNGYEAVLALRDPGDLIGELSSIDGLPRSANVQAVIQRDAYHPGSNGSRRWFAAVSKLASY